MVKYKLQSVIDEINSYFVYTPDHVKDYWRTLHRGYPYGDCEDFVLTVIKEYYGGGKWSFIYNLLLSGKAKIHYVEINGYGHAVGEIENYFFDNIQKNPVDDQLFRGESPYKYKHRFSRYRVLMKLLKRFLADFFAMFRRSSKE